ncbi:MAG: DUF1385 domain-containing protein [Deltaproteobacteria bacterium]|nr:DUF1385 domain-containing protein [Deltaproteobacteria bacterium]
MAEKKYTSIGGQAVIEGVMMRSPHYLAVAVRKPDSRIVIREMRWKGYGDRFPILKKPLLRGVVTLVESMVNGIEALSYSANVAVANDPSAPVSKDGKKEELSSWAMAGSIFFAFAMGMLIFVAAPHFLAVLLGRSGLFSSGVDNPVFHLVDGAIKVAFLVIYIYSISLMKDIYRVFQYHGAEHKSIYTFENGEDLTVENARKYTTLHPRCGTSFLLFLLVISILVFSAVFPVINLMRFAVNPVLNHLCLVAVKIGLMFPVAGISYEFIRASAARAKNPVCKALIWPGLMLQKLTTREPADDQLEVALASLKCVLMLEKTPSAYRGAEIELAVLGEIARVPATVAEFPEA